MVLKGLRKIKDVKRDYIQGGLNKNLSTAENIDNIEILIIDFLSNKVTFSGS